MQINVQDWISKLSSSWMQDQPDFLGVLYIDGHVNIYSGNQTKMPKRYASRLRLCVAGSTDYWVNDQIGQPFFVVSQAINSGMIEQIQTTIIPRLDIEIPNQPTEEALEINPKLHRYMLVCDRECFSADFFYDLWAERIAICTYKKNVKDKWIESDFIEYDEIKDGQVIGKIKLAEKMITLKTKDKQNEVSCREIRKLTKSGHQTAVITTNWMLSIALIGSYMFARWCQENFFKYMIENFDIDGLVSYSKEKISDTKMLVNPQYRDLEYQHKSIAGKLSRQKTLFANLSIKEGVEKGIKLEKLIAKKANILAEIEAFDSEKLSVKEKMKVTPRKITFAALSEQEKFSNAINVQKQFMDQIKMIAYRAETGMFNIIKNELTRPDEGRKLLQELFLTDADIHPDYVAKTITVKLHNQNHRNQDKIIQYLCNELNQTETVFPGSELKLIYKLVSA